MTLDALNENTGDEPEFSLENIEDDCLLEGCLEHNCFLDKGLKYEDDAVSSDDGDVDPAAYKEMYGSNRVI